MSIYGDLAYFFDAVVYGIVTCALVAYRVDRELASRANPVVFRCCIVEVGREELNYFRERSHWTCRLNTAI